MNMKTSLRWIAVMLMVSSFAGVGVEAAQKELQKLTVGYTPISGAALPFFIAVEEKIFQKYGYDVAGIFMGGSPLINAAILAGEFPIGYTGGGAIISSRLSGSDLIAIASPLPVLTIDGWAKPEIKSIGDLRGKRIGVTRFGASSYFSALAMLDSAGVKPSEVTFIQNGGVGESYAALIGRPGGCLHDRIPLRPECQERRASTCSSDLLRPNMASSLLPSSRRGSRGSKTPRTAGSRWTFYALSMKDWCFPERTRR